MAERNCEYGKQLYHNYYEKLLKSALQNLTILVVVLLFTYKYSEYSYLLYIGLTISVIIFLNTLSWFCRYWFHTVPIDKSWQRMQIFLRKGKQALRIFLYIKRR